MPLQTDINDETEGNVLRSHLHGEGNTCFLCKKKIESAVVYHEGYINGTLLEFCSKPDISDLLNQDRSDLLAMLVLHPSCAIQLSLQLAYDALQLRKPEEKTPLDTNFETEFERLQEFEALGKIQCAILGGLQHTYTLDEYKSLNSAEIINRFFKNLPEDVKTLIDHLEY